MDESWMVERAKEELQILESQHPNRFDYLKLELRSLISDSLYDDHYYFAPPSSAATQVSSNRKRKGVRSNMEKVEQRKLQKLERGGGSKDRVEIAIEKAEACLRKIRLVKQSFFVC